jgi:DNA repair exonuclease SbcCD ATPase subunit
MGMREKACLSTLFMLLFKNSLEKKIDRLIEERSVPRIEYFPFMKSFKKIEVVRLPRAEKEPKGKIYYFREEDEKFEKLLEGYKPLQDSPPYTRDFEDLRKELEETKKRIDEKLRELEKLEEKKEEEVDRKELKKMRKEEKRLKKLEAKKEKMKKKEEKKDGELDLDEDVKRVLIIMDNLLEHLPDEIIDRFAQSEDFALYEKIFNKYKIK